MAAMGSGHNGGASSGGFNEYGLQPPSKPSRPTSMLKADPLPPTPSLMAQRLSQLPSSTSPMLTAAAGSAPRTRPFEIREAPAPLYSSSTEPWSHSRPSAQTAPSRPPKIYDAPPPSINYRPAKTPERQPSFDSNHVPSIPPKITLEGGSQRPLEVRRPSPPSLFPSLSPATEQSSHRASMIFPPAPQLEEIKPSSPFEVQPPALPRRPSRPFEVEPSPERERRPSRPFEVQKSPNPLNLASETRESQRLFDVPFRSPMHFPPISSEKSSRNPSPAPRPALTLAERKASTPTFEFEPPIQRNKPSTEVSPVTQSSPVDTWAHHKDLVSLPQPTIANSHKPQQQVESPPSSPKSRPSRLALVEAIKVPSLEDIKPPPGPPPAQRKGKKSVSFAARDSLISPTSYGPQSPFSDDSQLPHDSPSLSPKWSSLNNRNRDSDQSLTELPIFIRFEDSDLTPRPTPAPATAPTTAPTPKPAPEPVQAGPSSARKGPLSPRSLPPLEIPPPSGPPPTVQAVPKPQDDDVDFDAAVAQLVDYGFTAEEAQRGLLENGDGVDVQAAANWLLDESNQPEPPPLPKRPGSAPDQVEPPSPLSPSDDASSDLYEAEPVSPVSIVSGVTPRLNASRVPASQRYSMVFPEDPALLPPRALGAQPPSPPGEKKDSSSFETYRPSSSSTDQAPPSPPSSKAPSLEQEQAEAVAQPPSYSMTDPRAPFPNPLHSHPVHVHPPRPKEAPHKIPRKKVPLPSLDTQFSNDSSSSGSSSAPLGSATVPLSAIGAGIAASLAAASGPAAPSIKSQAAQGTAPVLVNHSTTSSMSSITSTTMSPSSATSNPLKAQKKEKAASSKGWFAQIGQKTSKGFSNLANKVNTAGFVGETMEKECEKAARILRAFCKHGVYANNPAQPLTPAAEGPSPGGAGQAVQPTSNKGEKKLVRIPPELMQKAVGLAIFTTLRVGLGLGESTGSGIVIARLHDGSWSAPSAISLQSFGAGVAAGVDIFDCVCVINTQEALGAFMNTRFSLGAGVAVAAGPWGTGRAVEWGSMHNQGRGKKASISDDESPPPMLQLNDEPLAIQEPKPRRRGSTVTLEPVYSYVKSKGLFAGFSYEGNIVNERKETNTRFYGEPVTVEQILRGHARVPEDNQSLAALRECLRAAEDYDPNRGSAGNIGVPPSIQEEGVMDGDEQPEQAWPKDVKPKFPEDSLHPAEAFYSSRAGQSTYIAP